MSNNKIHLKIRDAQKIVFQGEVDRISSYNEVGPFDVYPMHANFISIIRKELSLYKDKEKIKQIEFEQAVLKVKKDVVKIFLGMEISDSETSSPQNDNTTAKDQKDTHTG